MPPRLCPGVRLRNGHKELAAVLRQAGARGESDLAFAIATGDAARLRTLLADAPSYGENPEFWGDALASAARVGDLNTVRAALEKGVPAKARADWKADAFAAAAGEGQDEALAMLLATRQPGADPGELRPALWDAVWNSHPYEDQRAVEHFEKCVRMLLAAGAPVEGKKGDKPGIDLVTAAVFSRNPGINPAVIEMLVRAGADPNPPSATEANPKARLLDAVQEACAKGYCSMPVAETLLKLSRFAPRQSEGHTTLAPPPSPSSTPQGQDAKPAQPDAAPR